MAETKESEVKDQQTIPCFNPRIANLSDSTRAVFENYSKIPADEVIDHCLAVRQKAWDVYPYPCIGEWAFLNMALGQHNCYAEILKRMKTDAQTYLDLGCAFAQDIRRLVADGVDSKQCYGADLRLEFLELGYELFRDKQTLKSEFIEANVFDDDSPLKKLDGKIDIINASAFFHLFTYDEQVKVAHRVGKLLKQQKDSLIVGRQVGDLEPGDKVTRDGNRTRFRHDVSTWKKLWGDVGNDTGVKYQVEATMNAVVRESASEDRTVQMMYFSIRRLN